MAKSPTQNFITGNVIEMEAEAAITARRLVKLGTAPGQAIHTSAITDVVIGVAINTAAIGERVQIQTDGIAEVACKAGVAYLAQVMPDSGGAGLCATAAGATAKSCGQACGTTTTAENEIQKVWLRTINVNGIANS